VKGARSSRVSRPGPKVRASVVVDGERLESQEFEVPASAASDCFSWRAAGAAPRRHCGGRADRGKRDSRWHTRFIVQFADDELEIFYLLEIVNSASEPVRVEPLVFDLPERRRNASLLDGSTPQALSPPSADGDRPFQPGRRPSSLPTICLSAVTVSSSRSVCRQRSRGSCSRFRKLVA